MCFRYWWFFFFGGGGIYIRSAGKPIDDTTVTDLLLTEGFSSSCGPLYIHFTCRHTRAYCCVTTRAKTRLKVVSSWWFNWHFKKYLLLFLLFRPFHTGAGVKCAPICLKVRREWGELVPVHGLHTDLTVLATTAPKPCKTSSLALWQVLRWFRWRRFQIFRYFSDKIKYKTPWEQAVFRAFVNCIGNA